MQVDGAPVSSVFVGRLKRVANSLFRRLRRGGTAEDEHSRVERVAGAIRQGSWAERVFVIDEVVGGLCYERYGIEVNPGDTVIDAGANVGVASAHFAINRGAGCVHSFEPIPRTFEALSANLAHLPQCHPHNLGLSSSSGVMQMTTYDRESTFSTLYPDESGDRAMIEAVMVNAGFDQAQARSSLASQLNPELVDCRFIRLSEFLATAGIERVDLLKIDVQRAEMEVLDGIDDVDWSKIRQVAAEVEGEVSLGQMTGRLKLNGFHVTVEQEAEWSNTAVRMLFATRMVTTSSG